MWIPGSYDLMLIREAAALLTLVLACGLLIILTAIDFRERLLPDRYVFPFAVSGVLFHIFITFEIIHWSNLLLGAVLGYGLLWVIRHFGSKYYEQEAMGLGDVKLMGAAGLWLGPQGVAMALTVGASLSIVHGIIYALIKQKSLRRLEIPAGPGLIGGILVMAAFMVLEKNWQIFAFLFDMG